MNDQSGYQFGTEASFSMFLSVYQIIEGIHLMMYAQTQTMFNEQRPCNIYFILKRPKLSVDKESVQIDGKNIHLDILIHLRDVKIPIPIILNFNKADSEIFFETNYPYKQILVHDGRKALIEGTIAAILDTLGIDNEVELFSLLDYEVLYIGQAYGKDGSKMALDRLAAHSTLQAIYAEALSNEPDADIWFMLANFGQKKIVSSNGTGEKYNEEIDEQRFFNFAEEKTFSFSRKEKIALTEAALIKYFQPRYNKNYRDNFSSKDHVTYAKCYELGIRSMAIELDTSEISRMLYTSAAPRTKYHFKGFQFDFTNDRYDLLDILK